MNNTWRPISEAEHLDRDEQIVVLTDYGAIQSMPAGSAFHMSNRGHKWFRRLDTMDLPETFP